MVSRECHKCEWADATPQIHLHCLSPMLCNGDRSNNILSLTFTFKHARIFPNDLEIANEIKYRQKFADLYCHEVANGITQ